jgi:hypothetical protein
MPKHKQYEADILMPDGSCQTRIVFGPSSWDQDDFEDLKVEIQAELNAEPIAGFRGIVLSVGEPDAIDNREWAKRVYPNDE